MRNSTKFLFVLLFSPFLSVGQFNFEYDDSIGVRIGTDTLAHAWVGGLNYAQFSDMDIPSNAITACGSWYAGAGDYFYLIPDKRNMLKVFQGWQDEGQETPGYHWKKAKEIHF